eukprot:SAG22_NODE_4367_length_1291_cov_1.454698_2_plen_96_part_01
MRPWRHPGGAPQRLVAIEYTSRSAPPSEVTGGPPGGKPMPAWLAELDEAARAVVYPYDMPGMPAAVSDGTSLRLASQAELQVDHRLAQPSLYTLSP